MEDELKQPTVSSAELSAREAKLVAEIEKLVQQRDKI